MHPHICICHQTADTFCSDVTFCSVDTFYVHTDPDSLPSCVEECSFGNWSSNSYHQEKTADSTTTVLHNHASLRSLSRLVHLATLPCLWTLQHLHLLVPPYCRRAPTRARHRAKRGWRGTERSEKPMPAPPLAMLHFGGAFSNFSKHLLVPYSVQLSQLIMLIIPECKEHQKQIPLGTT